MSQRWKIMQGDSLESMRRLRPDSIDAVVTDPPYGIDFDGRGWDRGIPGKEYWAEALNVTKPGGHIAAFSSTRTWHHLATAIEDAGWEILDTLMWLFTTGFPKGTDMAMAIDKSAGHIKKRGIKLHKGGRATHGTEGNQSPGEKGKRAGYIRPEPVSDEAKMFDGFHTRLKPAWEPIILARKPGDGPTRDLLAYGVGALNVDATRVGGRPGGPDSVDAAANPRLVGTHPSNLIVDSEVELDIGSKQRFYTCLKASVAEREAGLAAVDPETTGGFVGGYRNHHPTVKPIKLMRWVIRLLVPAAGASPARERYDPIILDPFCGSGSTGCASVLEGVRFVGMDLDRYSCNISDARIRHWFGTLGGSLFDATPRYKHRHHVLRQAAGNSLID